MNCTTIETFPLPRSCLFGNCINNTCVCFENYSSFQETFDLEGLYCSNNIYLNITFNFINILLGFLVLCKLLLNFRQNYVMPVTIATSNDKKTTTGTSQDRKTTTSQDRKTKTSKDNNHVTTPHNTKRRQILQNNPKILMYIKILIFTLLDISGQTLQIISILSKPKYLRKVMITLLSTKWPLFGYIMIKLAYTFFEVNWSSENIRAISNKSIPHELRKIKQYLLIIYLTVYPIPFSSIIVAGILDIPFEQIKIIVQVAIVAGTGLFELVVFSFIIYNISKLIKILDSHLTSKATENVIARNKKAQKIYLFLMLCTLPSTFSWLLPMIVNFSTTVLNFYSLCGLSFCLVILQYVYA